MAMENARSHVQNLNASTSTEDICVCELVWRQTSAVFIIFQKSRNTFQYPLSKRILYANAFQNAFLELLRIIIERYREYESWGRPCHCAAALRSLTRRAEIM